MKRIDLIRHLERHGVQFLREDASQKPCGLPRHGDTMAKKLKVWFDPEADYLEVQFREAPGFMRATAHDSLLERVDEEDTCWVSTCLASARFARTIRSR